MRPLVRAAGGHLQENSDGSWPLAKRFGDARDWFFANRLGLSIGWGLYSIPGWHPQHQLRARVSREEYSRLAQYWNPISFEPNAWLDLAQQVGMKYVCFTAKHHDGFCLWDTKLTSYNTMNTPCGKDIVGMLADACQRRSVPLCLYYSIADWHQPDYPIRLNELSPQTGEHSDPDKYVELVKGQIRELCTSYGPIHGIWWDMNQPQYVDPSISQMIRQLQPAAVINNRGFDAGDFDTPERGSDAEQTAAFDRPTEVCSSLGSESWGYRRDASGGTDDQLIKSIDRCMDRGANYVLKVGPLPSGELPPQSVAALQRLGKRYQG
ncbi:MAG TPA: alpha-L-fucosidase [Tepidisphaeraceae bacterium]|jgi:alpha-L-fucosidase